MTGKDIPTTQTFQHAGKTYRLSPLGLADMLEQAAYLRRQYMEEAKRQIEGLPLPLAVEAWKAAKAEADKLQLGTQECTAVSSGFTGLIYGFYLGLIKNHPDLSLTEATAIYESDIRGRSEMAAVAVGLTPSDPTEPVTPTPA